MIPLGMPTLIESPAPAECAALCHALGLSFIELNMNLPDTQITVTAADGTAIIYQPFLSLRDGSLAVPEDGTVYDFTVYPEGFVRETTA